MDARLRKTHSERTFQTPRNGGFFYNSYLISKFIYKRIQKKISRCPFWAYGDRYDVRVQVLYWTAKIGVQKLLISC